MAPIRPVKYRIRSVSVVFPESMCAEMPMLRNLRWSPEADAVASCRSCGGSSACRSSEAGAVRTPPVRRQADNSADMYNGSRSPTRRRTMQHKHVGAQGKTACNEQECVGRSPK